MLSICKKYWQNVSAESGPLQPPFTTSSTLLKLQVYHSPPGAALLPTAEEGTGTQGQMQPPRLITAKVVSVGFTAALSQKPPRADAISHKYTKATREFFNSKHTSALYISLHIRNDIF